MKDNHSYSFPSDFANALREIWGKLMGGQYSPPPIPSDLQLRLFLETTYLASMETDEARPLKFTTCVTPESVDFLEAGESEPIEVWPFTTDRQFSIEEIRRVNPLQHIYILQLYGYASR